MSTKNIFILLHNKRSMHIKNKKTALTDGFCFWQGQKDYLRDDTYVSASFTALFRYAHRRTPVRLSLVVKLSCRVRTLPHTKTKKPP